MAFPFASGAGASGLPGLSVCFPLLPRTQLSITSCKTVRAIQFDVQLRCRARQEFVVMVRYVMILHKNYWQGIAACTCFKRWEHCKERARLVSVGLVRKWTFRFFAAQRTSVVSRGPRRYWRIDGRKRLLQLLPVWLFHISMKIGVSFDYSLKVSTRHQSLICRYCYVCAMTCSSGDRTSKSSRCRRLITMFCIHCFHLGEQSMSALIFICSDSVRFYLIRRPISS